MPPLYSHGVDSNIDNINNSYIKIESRLCC